MKNLPTAPLKMISHKNKYIFVHIPKCGGTSIEKVLCTTENVDLNLDDTTEDFDVNRLSKEDRREYIVGINGKQHMFLDKFPPRYQKEYFCFTFVRNPWDLMVSKYYYSQIHKAGISFKKMILSIDGVKLRHHHNLKFNQADFINSNINYVGRFENLQGDFDIICDKIGMPRQQLEKLNTTKHPPYWECYDSQTRDIVARKYKKDLETFGYKWEPMLGF